MLYNKTIKLKDGRECLLRNGTADDGAALLEEFNLTHEQTDFLLTYPDENTFTVEEEEKYLKEKTESDNEIEIIAIADGKLVGSAGIESLGSKDKVKHRADFGISIDEAYWGLGIGSALIAGCIECARKAGYTQLELQAVAENDKALNIYRKAGFVEYGRNPRGYNSRYTGYQEVVLMRLELS
ncbi:MAG: GNAT family N-acetyltransferase [Lachnospiraceae bacterium]|nr:GNAT family N-acetyltransferase [Lachnospiraceae bacterium]